MTSKAKAAELFTQAVAAGLTLEDVLAAFGAIQSPLQRRFAQHACESQSKDGELEFDEGTLATISDNGAYVLGWYWVPAANVVPDFNDVKELVTFEALPLSKDVDGEISTLEGTLSLNEDGTVLIISTEEGEEIKVPANSVDLEVFDADSMNANDIIDEAGHPSIELDSGSDLTVIQLTNKSTGEKLNFVWFV